MMFHPVYGGHDRAARSTARSARSEASQAKAQAAEVKFDIERLLMITEALWMFLKEEHGWTDEQLQEKIQEIDLRDGKIDYRVGPSPPTYCPDCGKTLMKKRPFCLYCGTTVEMDPFER